MHRFLCTNDEEYEELRKHLNAADATLQKAVIPIIAGAIGATLGIAAAILVPFVALVILATGKIGKNAWCALHSDGVRLDTADSDGQPIKLAVESQKVGAEKDETPPTVNQAQP